MGEKTLRCVLVDGKLDWHARPPFCHRIRCYPPDNIPFGSHSGQPFEEFQYGSVVIYTCREGFSLIGNPVRTCSTSADGNHGEWQPAPPQCKVIRCREPEIKNGRVTSKPQPFYTYGDRANFECNPGYIMVGNSTCTCGPDYGWIPRFPICVESTPNATAATPPTAATPATPADPGGDDTIVPEIGTGADPALPPDDIEVDNSTTIIVGCVLGLLVIGSIAAVFWKFRSSAKTGEPEAPPPEPAAEFDAAELEPKGSVVE